MPVAVRGVFVPLARLVEVGVTAMLRNVAAVTAILAVGEVIPFIVAVTVVLPIVTPETTPVLLTAAVVGAAETQAACEVRSTVEPSV